MLREQRERVGRVDVDEVVARLHALLKRAKAERVEPPAGTLRLDPAELSVSVDGLSQTLTPTEFRLLAALASRPGRAVDRRRLVQAAWPHGAIVHENTLDVYIARLRRKLTSLTGAPEIATVHGVGYAIE